MRNGELGAVITPAQGMYDGLEGADLIVDNGKFGQGYPGDVEFLAFVASLPGTAAVRFVVAPDVVGDSAATLKMSGPFLPVIRAMGHKAALAAQNGLTADRAPWGDFDVLFLGGVTECLPCNWVRPAAERKWRHCPLCARQLTEWKTSEAAVALAREAVARGKPVHMGRVNGTDRLAIAEAMGCTTADGTLLAFGPDKNMPRVRRMTARVNGHPEPLFGVTGGAA
jgi:hypothetical protein